MPARRYTTEQPAGQDPATQQAWGSHQRAFDKIGLDIDRLETNVGADLETLGTEVESYTPGDASHWLAPAPTTQDEALDRLAALVYHLNGDTEIP